MRSWLLWGIGLAAAACVGPAMAHYAPTRHETDLPPEKLRAAAEGALLDHGHLIASRSPSRLETKPQLLAGSDIGKEKYRYTWIVVVSDGTVVIESTCERVSGDDASDCGDERPEKLVREQDKLLKAILEEAGSSGQ